MAVNFEHVETWATVTREFQGVISSCPRYCNTEIGGFDPCIKILFEVKNLIMVTEWKLGNMVDKLIVRSSADMIYKWRFFM